MESKNFKELSNNKSVIKNAMEIADKCRKLGLSNGASLGHHSGFADEVADCIETLLGYVNELENNQLIKTADPKTYRTPIMHLPNGDDVYVSVAQDQAIDIYRVNSDPEVSEDECLCFVERSDRSGRTDRTFITNNIQSNACFCRHTASGRLKEMRLVTQHYINVGSFFNKIFRGGAPVRNGVALL